MDRKSVIGIILIMAIMIVFAMLNKPSKEKLEGAKRAQDSIELLKNQTQQNKAISDTNAGTVLASNQTSDSVKEVKLKDQFGRFASLLKGNREFYTIENELIKVIVSNKGGRIYSVQLKKYSKYDNTPVVLFDGDSTVFGLNFYADNKSVFTNDMYFQQVNKVKNITVTGKPDSMSMRLYADSSSYIEYTYTLTPGSYMVGFTINTKGMNKILAGNMNSLDLNWKISVPRQEKGAQNENNYTNIYYKYYEDEVNSLSPNQKKDEVTEDLRAKVKWIAYKQQFFSSVLIAKDYLINSTIKSYKMADNSKYLKRFESQITIPYENISSTSIPMSFYFGPNHYKTLKQYHIDLEELVTLGKWIVKWINRFLIIPIFNFLNGFIGNFGIIILILTLIIKTALLPLTYKSYLSTARMKVLKPQIDEINIKIPKEKAMERQQATMALYKRAGVSPMGGCLPLLLQMPILFAMFRFFPTSIELRHQSFLWAHDLSTYDSIATLPFSIPFYGDHVSLFTILMTVTTIISMKMNDQGANTGNQMPGMKTMMYIMPVMFMFMLNSFSAALTYYYLLVNLITFGQNALFKRFVNEEDILKKLQENKKKPVKKSGFQARLEKMAKERGYKLPK
jgi:YidC/Oxa1 family membrane protein insertase